MSEVSAEFIESMLTTMQEAKLLRQKGQNRADVVREGTKVVLPKGMSYDNAIKVLEKKQKEDETEVGIREVVETHPYDGAYAMMEVLKQIYGWPTAQPTPGFFGPQPPKLIDIDIGYKQKSQIIWGQFSVPGIEGYLEPGATKNDNGRWVFYLGGVVKQKHKGEIKELADAIRRYVDKNSVYKGQAVRIITDEDGDMDINAAPQFFLDVDRVNEEELTFSEKVADQVQTNLFTPIEKTEQCRQAGVPLKRGVLLEGPYGTGKTLTAYVVAKKCIENNWTFIYLDRVTGIKDALIFARQYAPAVVFSEDIDRALDGERDLSVDDILNTIDGVDSKNLDIMTILTTNHVEKIEKAMLRPGRLDAIISVQAPDEKAAEKLMRIYGRGLINTKENLAEAAKELAGQIPAVIREVIERAKLYAINRLTPGQALTLNGTDVLGSALSMKHHLSLMKPKGDQKSREQVFGEAFIDLVGDGINGTKEVIKVIDDRVEEIHDRIM